MLVAYNVKQICWSNGRTSRPPFVAKTSYHKNRCRDKKYLDKAKRRS